VGIIRVGVVGAGWIAREHRRVLDSVAEAELAAVCDLDPERAGELAAGTGARVYTDWRDLLDREDLGALLVCTPPRSPR
jgi:predicted dehydrogenase